MIPVKSDVFVSVVLPVRNMGRQAAGALATVAECMKTHFSFFEIIVVDEASSDATVAEMTTVLERYEGIRIIELSRRCGVDIAISAGFEGAVGECVAVLDLVSDPVERLPELVMQCLSSGAVLYGTTKRRNSNPFRALFSALFHWYCGRVLGIDIQRNAGIFRVYNRAATNAYINTADRTRDARLVTASLGFELRPFDSHEMGGRKASWRQRRSFLEDVNSFFEILVFTSRHPLRWASFLGLVAAAANLVYVCYVIGVIALKDQIAEGWVTLSLQNAFMFLLLSLALALLCECVGKILAESQKHPLYTVLRERNSSVLVDASRRRNIVSESA
jgi:glycosyltransferase involved in cell wall biosynthesis